MKLYAGVIYLQPSSYGTCAWAVCIWRTVQNYWGIIVQLLVRSEYDCQRVVSLFGCLCSHCTTSVLQLQSDDNGSIQCLSWITLCLCFLDIIILLVCYCLGNTRLHTVMLTVQLIIINSPNTPLVPHVDKSKSGNSHQVFMHCLKTYFC